jgi:hypothetical protein
MGEQAAGEDENQSGSRQGPSAVHGNLPICRTVEPALGPAFWVRFAGSLWL